MSGFSFSECQLFSVLLSLLFIYCVTGMRKFAAGKFVDSSQFASQKISVLLNARGALRRNVSSRGPVCTK